MGNFKNLKVWQRARRLSGNAYRATQNFPVEERFGLTSQIRRAAASIMSNIAEGSGRDSDREMLRYVKIALGSSRELESNFILAQDLELASSGDLNALRREVEEIRRMLARLAQRLKGED